MADEELDQQLAELPEGWKVARLGDMISLRGGLSYKGEFLSDSGNSLVTMGCVSASERFKKSGLKRYSGDFTERHRLRVGDMVIATRDVTQNRELLGSPALVPEGLPGEAVIAATNLYMVANHSESPTEFLYWLMKTPAYRNQIVASAKGTTIVMLTKDSVENFTFPLPPLAEQKAIAAVLGALDDKIELNRRMNATLEAMARALFQSWFVDFDPVRAKFDGRKPIGLDETTAALFPDSFQESSLGHTPKGWEVVSLDALASIRGGKQLPTEDCLPAGKFSVFGANGIMGYATESTHDGFVVAFGRVGAYCGSIHWSLDSAWINNNASAVVPLQWPAFVLQTMLNIDFNSMRTGSAQPFIPNSSLASAKALRPSPQIAEAFSRVVEPLRRQQGDNDKQSRTLSTLRDTLLPKLLSGELSVS